MLRFANVAVPLEAATTEVPESVPDPGFESRATLTEPVKLGTLFP